MDDRDQDGTVDKTSELKTVLPFMTEFPFGDYDISMVERGDDLIKLGVSPILVKEFGDNGTIRSLNFYYIEDGSDISISLYAGDVEWIAEEAVHIKKVDALRKTLDTALSGDDLLLKIKAIKAGRKFAKLLNCDTVTDIDFNGLILDFLSIYETSLTSRLKLGLQKLSGATLKSTEFSEKQFKAVRAFLNFQIHYIKILLGIVIAAKIY
jgi:hypothetical protein